MSLSLCDLKDILDSYAEELGVKVELNDCNSTFGDAPDGAIHRSIDENTRQFVWKVVGYSDLNTSRLICAILTSFA